MRGLRGSGDDRGRRHGFRPGAAMRSPMTAEGRFRGPGGRLRGRAKECALLDDLVSAIRRGESRSLVLRGEAGIGKTALLEYLIASAPDATVVGCQGPTRIPTGGQLIPQGRSP